MAYKPEERVSQQERIEQLERSVELEVSRAEALALLSVLSVARALLLQCSQQEQQGTA